MLRSSHRVAAFSLMEMLVVLILSSIMLSIVYLAYYNIFTYQKNLERKQAGLDAVSRLYFLMKKDVVRSRNIVALSPVDFECEISSLNSKVIYQFYEDLVVRQQEASVDTFACTTGDPIMFWQRQRVQKFPARIDEIDFQLNLNDTISISLFKQYDAASLIETHKPDTVNGGN